MASPTPSSVVSCIVMVAGKELTGEFLIISVTVTKEVNRVASAVVSFLDGNVAKQEFTLSDKDDLKPGKEIEIKVGYDTDTKTIFKGIIVRHGVKLRSGSTFTVIECKDKAIKLTSERKNELFLKKKDDAIIKEVIGKHSGVSAKSDSCTYKHPQLLQYDCTDWDFIIQRAEMNGLLVFNNENEINAAKPDFSSAKLTLEFGSDLFEFEADIDAVSQNSKVISSSWNVKDQKIVKNTTSSASFAEAGNLKSSDLKAVVGKDGFNAFHAGAIDDAELGEWGKSRLLRSKMARLRGRTKSNGYDGINPGDGLELKGIGKKFNGTVFVSAVRHEIYEGKWHTHTQFGFSDTWHIDKYKTEARHAAGLIPPVHGLQTGKVTKICDDPDGQNRLEIQLPIFGEGKKVWARMAFADAGNERGVYFIPEVDDEVLVGFLNEDARFPVILGTLHSSTFKPPWTTDKKNKDKGIVSREKIKVAIDDTDKILTLETPGENTIVLSDKDKAITIKDKKGDTAKFSEGNILIDGKDKIEIKSKKIEVTGTTSIELKVGSNKIKITTSGIELSGTKIENKAQASFKAKGAMYEVSASGMGTVKSGGIMIVKGSLVKIN